MQIKCKKSDFTLPYNSAGVYLLNVNNGNTRTMREICSKLTVTLLRRFSAFTVNVEQTSHCSAVFIAEFEQVYAGWVVFNFMRLKFHIFPFKVSVQTSEY